MEHAPVLQLPALEVTGRRQAPYSSEVRAAMRDGAEPNTYIYAGEN